MANCPNCNNDNSIKLDIETIGTETAYKRKNYYFWKVDIYLCLECNNIFGEKHN